jgi:hypothetical protein
MKKTSFSATQLELLKMFNYDVPEQQWLEVKKLLADYFANKASDEADRLWNARGWSDDTMENWANEHMRKKK